MLTSAFRLEQGLRQSIRNEASELWRKVYAAWNTLSKYSLDLSDPRVRFQRMIAKQQFWLSDTNDPIQTLLKWLVFFGHAHNTGPCIFYQNFSERQSYLDLVHQLINHCCIKFRQFELLWTRPSRWTTVNVEMRVLACIEWPESHDQSDIDSLFWTLYGGYAIPITKGTYGWIAWAKGVLLYHLVRYLASNKCSVDKQVVSPQTNDDFSRIMEHLSNSVEYDGDINLMQMLLQIHPCITVLPTAPDDRSMVNAGARWQWSTRMAGAVGRLLLGIRTKSPAAKAFLVEAMFATSSITTLFLSSKYLSKACKACGEYGMSLKALSLAYKTCHHEDDSLLKYKKKARSLRRKLVSMRCRHCGIPHRASISLKFRWCTGCMKVVYCSKRCQKLDWNSTHRMNCNKDWADLYPKLKTVFSL